MNKEDWIWIVIRALGIYLVVMAIMNIPDLILYFWQSYGNDFGRKMGTAAFIDKPDSESCKRLYEQMSIQSVGNLLHSFLKVAMFSVIGSYLLKEGKSIFNLMNRTA